MKLDYSKCKTRAELLILRDTAVMHLRDVRKTQSSDEPWLPAIADAVVGSLEEFIDSADLRLDRLDNDRVACGYRTAIQMSFDFLFDHTISEDKIPF